MQSRIFHTPPGAPSEQIRATAAFYSFVDPYEGVDVDRIELIQNGELQAELQFRSDSTDFVSQYHNILGNFVPVCQEGDLRGLYLVTELPSGEETVVEIPSEWCDKLESGSWDEAEFLEHASERLERI